MAERPSGLRDFEPAWLARSLDRYLSVGLVFMAALIAAFPIYRIRESGLRADAAREQQVNDVAAGTSLFSTGCASCHGAAGTGGTAPTLNSKQFFASITDPQMAVLISTGVPGSSMSAWSQEFGGTLTADQIRQIVTYLRSLEPTAPSVPDWRTGKKASG